MIRTRSKNFEDIYLRVSTLKRFIPNADLVVLQDAEFKRVIKYMTNLFFNGSTAFLKTNGFDIEDIESIVTLFGLAFWGMPNKGNLAGTDRYNVMMRFIQQKCSFFIDTVGRKFDSGSAIIVAFDHFNGLKSGWDDHSIEMDGEKVWIGSDVQNEDPENRLIFLEDTTFALEERLRKAEPSQQSLIEIELKSLKIEAQNIRKGLVRKRQEFNGNREATLDKLRQLFLADPHKYTNEISYYATTKHVSKDVRKKARLMCNKHGIDYKKWLKEKLSTSATDSVEFDCT